MCFGGTLKLCVLRRSLRLRGAVRAVRVLTVVRRSFRNCEYSIQEMGSNVSREPGGERPATVKKIGASGRTTDSTSSRSATSKDLT